MKWTHEQHEAITRSFDKTPILVSAAAGSGKTAVLVERVIRLLTDEENPIFADKIVLMTFTRKAALEMKERFEAALKSRPETPLIRKQLMRLEDAKIMTINAFCLALLRENATAVGLEAGFRVADESELELLKKEAMKKTLERFYDFERSEIEPVCKFFGEGSDAMLRRAIEELHKFTSNIPDAEDWLDKQLRLYDNPIDYFDEIVPDYCEAIDEDIAKAIKLTRESLNKATNPSTRSFLKDDIEFFEDCRDEYEITEKLSRMNVKYEPEKTANFIRENREKVKKLREKIVSASELIPYFQFTVKNLRPVITTLVRLYQIYSQAFASVKRARKVVDFSDAEQLILQLLQERKSALRRIQNDYDLIIVDEFQDSNFLQYEIFRLLDCDENGDSYGKLFLVGDIKQSIYKFRGADSAVFDKVSRRYDYHVMYLSKNFRSSKQVVDAVNRIFEPIMPDYDENTMLKPGREIDNSEYEPELCLFLKEKLPKNIDETLVQATYTAQRIKKMVSEGFVVFDRKQNRERKCDWGDFAVLSSTGEKTFKIYEKVFKEQGVPCVSKSGAGYFKAEEIGLALDLLMAINNPYNDLSLFNIMMSPLYSFTAEEIAVIRATRKQMPLYSAALAAEKTEKISAFLKSIARYRRMADVNSAAELITTINSEGGFLPLVAATGTKGDSRKKANISLLTYYAEMFAKTKTDSSLTAFLSYINDLKALSVDVQQANPDGSGSTRNSVKLLTIHASKGLEFPICFLTRVHKEFVFRGDKSTSLVKFDKTAGIVADYFNESDLCRFKSLHCEYAARIAREQTIEEEKRKLYVAATRAECKLIFTGILKVNANDRVSVRENSYLAWLDGHVEINFCEFSDDNAPCVNESEGASALAANECDVDAIRRNIAAVYPRKALGAIPRKLTATQVGVEHSSRITGEGLDEPSVFPRTPSFHGLKRLTGKKRGDAYHKAMELIDFAKGDYAEQLKSIEHRFTAIEYKAINPRDIVGFFESELGKRAIKSDKEGNVVKEYKLYTKIELSELGIDFDGELPALETHELPLVQGIADMFFYENNEIVLVDYKTNRNTTREKLSRDYKGQLHVYKKAIEEMTGVKVKECLLYSFELGEIKV